MVEFYMRYSKYIYLIIFIPVLLLVGYLIGTNKQIFFANDNPVSLIENEVTNKPLEIYSIDNLSKADIKTGNFNLGIEIDSNDSFKSYNFDFLFHPNPEKSYKRKTTGLINIPESNDERPIIIMLRGYVDQEIYKTGMGTARASEIFAENGFITVAPDFLGYADSDKEADNIFESRFQTYTTVLSLIKSLYQIDKWNDTDIFLWGHSNGGQIALTILEIIDGNFPTSLWAPVSKPFPYSILYYTDEAEDRGKLIRSELAKFEADYNTELYSLDNYYERISAPIQIHQGTSDDAVPENWTNNLVSALEDLSLNLDYYTYPNTDHNMRPSWDTVVERDVSFYKKYKKIIKN